MASSSLSTRPHAPPSFASLPDDLSLRILEAVPLTERHTSCCLVSKHWHSLVHSPQLLRSLDINLPEDSSQPLRRLRSLAAWLQKHAGPGQLQALRFDGQLPINRSVDAAEADALTEGMLAHCGGLTSLRLAVSWGVRVGGWLAGMPNLRLLRVEAWGDIEVTTPRQLMPPLTELHLQTSSQVLFKPWAGLPNTAVKLCLGCAVLGSLLAEFSALSQLRYLRLEGVSVEAAATGLPFLPLLSRLEQLHLRACAPLPQCVSQLTQLRALSLADDDGWYWDIEEQQGAEVTGAVALAALPELTRLTFLALSEMPGMASLPAYVSALTELRALYWDGGMNANGECLDPASAALPHGSWLDGLHTLATFPTVLLGTLPLLGAAAQLQCIGVLNWYSVEMEDMAAAVRCAAGWPGLRRLLVEVDAAELPELPSLAAGEGQQLPPGLLIETQPQQQICSFLIEECGASM